MPTREQMRGLGQEIIKAHDARTESAIQLRRNVAELRHSEREQLKELHHAHQAMARQLRKGLARGRSELGRSVTAQMKRLDAAHQAMARRQRTTLSRGRADLARDVAHQMKDSHAGHQAMARRQRTSLSQGRVTLARDVAHRMKESHTAHRAMARHQRSTLSQGRANLAHDVAHQMKESHTAREAMAQQQRDSLAKARADLTQAEAGRKGEVAAWMTAITDTRAGARAEWQDLAATMQARRRGTSPVARAPKREAAPGAVEGSATLPSRIFEYLANHPDGTRLTELEQEFRLARIQLARPAKAMIDEGKVEKRGLLYFAI